MVFQLSLRDKVHHGNLGPATFTTFLIQRLSPHMSAVEHSCLKCGDFLTPHVPRVLSGNNCGECGKYSYSADQPSYLYLLTHQHLQLHKVGIGTVGKDKGLLEKLINEGWSVQGLWHDSDKRITFAWERAVFEELRVKLSVACPEAPGLLGKSDKHWVESISAQAISVSALAQIISTILAQ